MRTAGAQAHLRRRPARAPRRDRYVDSTVTTTLLGSVTDIRATLAAALLALVVYLPSLGNGFAFDDEGDIRENPTIVDASGPMDVLLSPYRGQVPPQRSPYRPVTSLSLWMNWVAGGDGPVAFHAVNVLLHVLASTLVVRLLLALGCGAMGALVGGALFAVHPIHVEAVANLVGRADVLATIFSLLAALAWLSPRLGSAARAASVAVAYAFALGSKEIAVVLPGLLLALSWARPNGRRLGGEVARLVPTVAVLGGYLLVRLSALGLLVQRDTAPYLADLPTAERLPTAVANLAVIGRLLVAPWDLAADYGPDVIRVVGLGSVRFWMGALSAGLCIALAWQLRRRDRLGTLALAWIGLSILVVSNLPFAIGIWVAERTLYLASVGVSIGAAVLVGVVGAQAPRALRGTLATCALVVALGAWKTVDRIPSWHDTEAVFRTLAEEHPESFRGQWWLARRLTDVGDYEGGLRWFEVATATSPNDLRLKLDHARTLLMAGRPAEAEALVAPLPGTDPARYVYLAQSRIMTDRPGEARRDVLEGLERFPSDERLIGQARELGIEP